MAIIRTILGDIQPEDLGLCLPHEHLYGWPPPDFATDDLTLDSESLAVEELGKFKAAGGGALVEMTTPDYNRDAAAMRRIALASDIHVIGATGYNKEKFSASFLSNVAVETLAHRFVAEVNVGMDSTDCRAGLIKASSTLNEISPMAKRLFQAAALAHYATGAPISTHTEAGTMALEQVELLVGEGVKPRHIIIGHVDRRLDWDYILRLAQTGVYLGFDQISKEKYYPDALRVEFIMRLTAEGHGNQILLSGDLARQSYWQSKNPQAGGFAYIPQQFVRMLSEAGVSAQTIYTLTVSNPARALAFSPKNTG